MCEGGELAAAERGVYFFELKNFSSVPGLVFWVRDAHETTFGDVRPGTGTGPILLEPELPTGQSFAPSRFGPDWPHVSSLVVSAARIAGQIPGAAADVFAAVFYSWFYSWFYSCCRRRQRPPFLSRLATMERCRSL